MRSRRRPTRGGNPTWELVGAKRTLTVKRLVCHVLLQRASDMEGFFCRDLRNELKILHNDLNM